MTGVVPAFMNCTVDRKAGKHLIVKHRNQRRKDVEASTKNACRLLRQSDHQLWMKRLLNLRYELERHSQPIEGHGEFIAWLATRGWK